MDDIDTFLEALSLEEVPKNLHLLREPCTICKKHKGTLLKRDLKIQYIVLIVILFNIMLQDPKQANPFTLSELVKILNPLYVQK